MVVGVVLGNAAAIDLVLNGFEFFEQRIEEGLQIKDVPQSECAYFVDIMG
jgi:hypothetical protein